MSKKNKETTEETLARLNKKYGNGSVMTGVNHISDISTVPHKTLALNIASEIGGLPRACLIQIEGNQHVGKTTFVLEMIGVLQKLDPRNVGFANYEQTFDKKYAKKLGVDTEKLIFCQKEYMEDGYEVIEEMIKSGNFSFIFIDSLNRMAPKAIIESGMSDKHVAEAARIHDKALLKIKPLLKEYDCSVIGITQYRDNIGAMGAGNDKALAGGNSWKFDTDFRIKLARLSTKKEDGYVINNVEITKNKVGSPYGKEKWYMGIGTGTDEVREILEYGKENDIIEMKGGGHYSYADIKLGQGIDNVREFFDDNPELFIEVKKALYQKLNLKYE